MTEKKKKPDEGLCATCKELCKSTTPRHECTLYKKKLKKPKRQKFSMRQQKYKKNRILGMNQYNAARAAGYSEGYSRQACRIEKVVEVSMGEHLEQAGLTDKAIAERIEELTRCTTLKTTKDESFEVTDNANRLKAIELAGKFSGKLTTQKVQIEGQLQHSGSVGFFEEMVKKAGVTEV